MTPELRQELEMQCSVVKREVYRLRSLTGRILQTDEMKLTMIRFQKAYDALDEFQEWVKAR